MEERAVRLGIEGEMGVHFQSGKWEGRGNSNGKVTEGGEHSTRGTVGEGGMGNVLFTSNPHCLSQCLAQTSADKSPRGDCSPAQKTLPSSMQTSSRGCARGTSDLEAPPGRAHHPCESRGGVQHTWDAGKNLTDPDEQVLRGLPPDGQWCCIICVLPNLLGHRLVVTDVL